LHFPADIEGGAMVAIATFARLKALADYGGLRTAVQDEFHQYI